MTYFSLSFSCTFSVNGRDSISICDTVERTVMRNSSCIQMGNFEGRNALRLKTAFHSIRWIARIINVVTVTHDIQSAETIKPRPFNVVQGCWVRVHQSDSRHWYAQIVSALILYLSFHIPRAFNFFFVKLYTKLVSRRSVRKKFL